MTTPLPTSPAIGSAPARRPVSLPEWMREPLLHFAVLGGLLFAIDHFIVGQAGDPHSIVISAEVDKEAKQLFKASRGREPDAAELAALRRVWLDNEVLYREGLAMQVDRGDSAIRLLETGVKLPPFDDKKLREWFESHRSKYDEPPRYDFQEAVLSGDVSEAAVRVFVDALNAGTPGDAKAGLRVFKGRPHANLVQSYGAEFAKALEESPVGEWRALTTREGMRAMRLDVISPARPAAFEPLRGVVLQDWTDATMAEQRTAAVRVLEKKYKVTIEAAAK
jgi:hypothetical protein